MIRRLLLVAVVGWCLSVGSRNAGGIEAVVDLVLGAAILVALARRMPEALRAIGERLLVLRSRRVYCAVKGVRRGRRGPAFTPLTARPRRPEADH